MVLALAVRRQVPGVLAAAAKEDLAVIDFVVSGLEQVLPLEGVADYEEDGMLNNFALCGQVNRLDNLEDGCLKALGGVELLRELGRRDGTLLLEQNEDFVGHLRRGYFDQVLIGLLVVPDVAVTSEVINEALQVGVLARGQGEGEKRVGGLGASGGALLVDSVNCNPGYW